VCITGVRHEVLHSTYVKAVILNLIIFNRNIAFLEEIQQRVDSARKSGRYPHQDAPTPLILIA
jgi:hypothetical protein